MNIVLTGPMGSGKTSVGKNLAKALNMNLVDTDQLIMEKTGMSIVGIFKTQGQGHFRELEEEIVKQVSKLDNHVISTGGGVVLRPGNMRRLRRNGLVINLRATVDTLFERLKNNKDRPLLHKPNPKEELRKHSEGREPFYNNADSVVETDNLDVDHVVKKIVKITKQPRIRICACIAGKHPAEQIEQAVEDGANIIELRLDLIEKPKTRTAPLIAMSALPIIATDRKNKQNLIRAIEAGCDFIDIEAKSEEKEQVIEKAKLNGCKIIVSAHDFEKTPENLTELVEATKGGDIAKIVTTAKTEKDCERVLALNNGSRIAFCMGEIGQETRIKALLCGSFLTYSGSIAPGQMSTKKMVEECRKRIEIKTLCIIGDPVEHSLSPRMHNAAIRKLGLEQEFVYTKIQVKPDELEQFVQRIRTGEISGVSVTIPHKQAVLELVDEVTENARIMGAANTLFMKNGKLIAHNTDRIGFLKALEENTFDPAGKKVVLLGAGGAACAIAHSLDKAAEIVIVNRSKEKAESLAKELKNARVGENEQCDLLVNTTPACPVDEIKAKVVMDINYKPIKTELLKLAEKTGAKTIVGTEMLLHQGTEQFEIFAGRKAPVEIMRKALLEALHEHSS